MISTDFFYNQTMIPSIQRMSNMFDILRHIQNTFAFVMHLIATKHMFLPEFVVIGTAWVCCYVNLNRLVYDSHFFLCDHLQSQ